MEQSPFEWKSHLVENDITQRERFCLTTHENIVYIHGGYHNGELTSDFLEIKIETRGMIRIRTSKFFVPRAGHKCKSSTDGLLMFFGGIESNQHLNNNIEIYDSQENCVFQIEASGEKPLGRERHSSAYWDMQLFIFGGKIKNGDQYEISQDFFIFQLETLSWEKVHREKKCPPARYDHCSGIIRGNFIVFGGRNDTQIFNDIWLFNYSKLNSTWKSLKTLGNIPSPRYGHSNCVIGRKYFTVYGGCDGVQALNDLYLYDFDTQIWWKVQTLNNPARLYGDICFIENKLYYFGGRDKDDEYGDIFSLDIVELFHCEEKRMDYNEYIIFQGEKKKDKTTLSDFEVIKKIAKAVMTEIQLAKRSDKSIVPKQISPQKKQLKFDNQYEKQVKPFFQEDSIEDLYIIKKVSKQGVVKAKQVDHFLSEREIVPKLNHPFIPKFEFLKDQLHLYIITKYIEGGTLFEYMYNDPNFVVSVEAFVKFYSFQVVLLLEYLQSLGIILRNLKPENMMIEKDGYIRFINFSYSKHLQTDRTFTVCGTPEYMSPEMILNIGYSSELDWWTFGIFLYELKYKTTPFENEDPMKIFENVLQKEASFIKGEDLQFKSLVKALLHKDKAKRLIPVFGLNSLTKHPFYKNIQFFDIIQKVVKAPIKVKNKREGLLQKADIIDEEKDEEQDEENPVLLMEDPFKDY